MADTPVEIRVQEKLDAEIKETRVALGRADDALFELQGQYDLATAELGEEDPTTPELDALHRRLLNAIARGRVLSEKLQILRSPSEFERRVNQAITNATSLRRLTMSATETTETTAAPKKPTPAEQGVPAVYLNEAGTKFRTGMDARLKSDLVESITGGITAEKPGSSLHIFDEKTAKSILEARAWGHFLERKVQILAEKTAAADKRAKEREAAAREKAEAKAKSDAEKAAAKAAAAANGDGEEAPARPSGKNSSSKTDQARALREEKAAQASA